MYLGFKELIYNKKKYLLVEILIILLMFMVLFLGGLAEGLGRAVTSGIETMPANYFVVSDDAEQLITVSSLDLEVVDSLSSVNNELATLDIQRMYLMKEQDGEKLNITYFAMEPGSFIEPEVSKGNKLSSDENLNQIILDSSFESEGIEIGSKVYDSATNLEFEVVGFVDNEMYGHTAVGIISRSSYTRLRQSINPYYVESVHALVSKDEVKVNVEGVEVASKKDIISSIPSYSAEHLTINMIVWTLIVVSAIIIGVFYYIITLQKYKQYGVLKALGLSDGELHRLMLCQVGILAIFGSGIAVILTYLMSAFLPASMPYYLRHSNVVISVCVFILVSIASSLISVSAINKVDPISVIGGNE